MEIGQLQAGDYLTFVENDSQNYVSDDLLLLRNAIKVNEVGEMEINKPYRISEGRILLVTQGKAVYQMNMIDYTLEPFNAFIVPANCVVVIKNVSKGFDLQAMSIKDLGENVFFPEVLQVSLADDDWRLMSEYINLLWHIVHRQKFSLSSVHQIQEAMLCELGLIYSALQTQTAGSQPSHVQRLFSGFVRLINEYGAREHHISFYAERLFITPNRLSELVKEQSGETVIQWVNRAIILEAKVLLRHSDLKNYEIAERLNFPNASFFNKFFRKQTGQTPLEYKKS